MESSHWPQPGLRLRTPDLLSRPTTETDLPAVAATLSADIASHPQSHRFPGLDESTTRATSAHQSYWQSVGNWSMEVVHADWEATGQAVSVEIGGFERCRPVFGL
jgi:hypothetical protein